MTSPSTPTRIQGERRKHFIVPAFLLAAGVFLVALISLRATDLRAFHAPPFSDGPAEAVFPLPESYAGSYTNDWGAVRVQGKHEGTDIFAPEGTTIRSATDGTVVRSFGSDEDGWNDLGGYTVMVRALEDVGPIEGGDLLYYAHMNSPSGLQPGEEVEAGRRIGEVGDTGQGPKVTRGEFRPHLHLGWYGPRRFFGQDRARTDSGAMNPYPLLRWIEQREQRNRGEDSQERRNIG